MRNPLWFDWKIESMPIATEAHLRRSTVGAAFNPGYVSDYAPPMIEEDGTNVHCTRPEGESGRFNRRVRMHGT